MTSDAGRRPDHDPRDHDWMLHALQLAERGWGRVHPNPMVGAVVVQGDRVVGEGWHAEFGEAHAEVRALAAAGDHARGATLYVTLEPCAHHGKQPPCVDAVIAAGIARVVIAMPDPNPVAAGGMARLRGAGIVVESGVEAEAAALLNASFAHQFRGLDRPFVAVKLAVSMDGCVADAAGVSQWLSGEAARAWVHHLRAGFEAIAVGGHTAIADDVRLTVRGDVVPRVPPTRVIFDRIGALPSTHGILHDGAGAPVVIAVGPTTRPAARSALTDAGADVMVAETLADALAGLHARGITSVLVEGGGRLAGALLAAGLIDRIHQIQCPIWLGDGVPAWAGLGTPSIGVAPRWRVVRSTVLSEHGETLMILEP